MLTATHIYFKAEFNSAYLAIQTKTVMLHLHQQLLKAVYF